MKFPTIKEMAQNVAEKAFDEYEYKGKTLRQWVEIISASEHGTDCISREQAIDALERAKQNIHHNIERAIGDAICEVLDTVESGIKQLPPIQHVIVPCDYVKACNEATMNKLTSAVAYYDALEELRKHGYVLVDMREVNNESN